MSAAHEFHYRLPDRIGGHRVGSHAGRSLGPGQEFVSHVVFTTGLIRAGWICGLVCAMCEAIGSYAYIASAREYRCTSSWMCPRR